MTTKGGGGAHDPQRPQALPAKAATADLATLVDQLVKLGLDFAADALPAILTRAVKEDLGSPALLEQLLRGEIERREERRVRTSLHDPNAIALRAALTTPPQHPAHPMSRPARPASTPPPSRPSAG